MKEAIGCDKYDHYRRSLANQPNHEQFKGFQKHEEEGWCGPACLQYVARCCGIDYTQSQLARILNTSHENGTSHYQMFCGAMEIGLQPTQVLGLRIEALAEVLPQYHVIVNWMDGPNEKDDGHYSILKSVTEDMVHLEDGTMWIKDFEKNWYDIEKEGRVNRWAMIVRRGT
jgi:ABC-type bacteriocin/lantibiotic exporter with double-glycine peptidase domain